MSDSLLTADNTTARSGASKRRILLWAAAVASVVVALVAKMVFPEWSFLPDSVDALGPVILLTIFLAALGCEFIDSSLGMGYGTTLTPLLLLMGFEPLEIVPCVLLSEFATGLTAGLMHHRDGNVDLVHDKQVRQTMFFLSMLSVLGTLAAVTLALRVPKMWLSSIIAVIILSVGLVTLATIRRRLRYRPGHIILLGTVAAFNKGLSGGGYGPLVTSGQVVSGLSPKQAVAVTSLAESLTCLAGLIAYLLIHGGVSWALAVPLTAGAMLSVPVATLAVSKIPENAMRATVGGFTCFLGCLTLVQALF